jgi:hypothetical protein
MARDDDKYVEVEKAEAMLKKMDAELAVAAEQGQKLQNFVKSAYIANMTFMASKYQQDMLHIALTLKAMAEAVVEEEPELKPYYAPASDTPRESNASIFRGCATQADPELLPETEPEADAAHTDAAIRITNSFFRGC